MPVSYLQTASLRILVRFARFSNLVNVDKQTGTNKMGGPMPGLLVLLPTE